MKSDVVREMNLKAAVVVKECEVVTRQVTQDLKRAKKCMIDLHGVITCKKTIPGSMFI